MMNLGITNITNPYLWSSFGPYAWMSDYGDQIQMNFFPSRMPYFMAEMAHGMLTPEHVSQWNPMFSVPVQNYFTDPALIQKGLQDAYNYGRELARKAMDGEKFSQAAQNVSKISGQCESLLADDKLNDEQKTKLKEVQDRAKALQKELEECKKQLEDPNADKTEARKTLDKISKEVTALEKEYVELVKTIKSELEALEKAYGDKDENKTDEKPKADEKPAEEEAAVEEKPSEKPEKNSELKYSQSHYATTQEAKTKGAEMAAVLFNAIEGFGTKDENLKSEMDKVNKDNVMELLDTWNKSYAKRFGGESLLESIYGDVFWGDDREEYTRKLMEALAEKAKEAGIDISNEYNQLNEELKAWWRDDAKIYELINTIHKNLGGFEYKAEK